MPLLGLSEFLAAIKRVQAGANDAARLGVEKGLAFAEAEAKKNFQGSHAKGQPHSGSGQPNIVTGSLRRSIRSDPIAQLGIADYSGRLGPTTVYARRVELGWPHGDGTPGHQATRPFPYFTPAADKTRDRFPDIVSDIWRDYLA